MVKVLAWWRMSLLVVGMMAGAVSAHAQESEPSGSVRVVSAETALDLRIARLDLERSQLTMREPLTIVVIGSAGALATLGYAWFTALAPHHGENYERKLLIATGSFSLVAALGAGWMVQRAVARRRVDDRLRELRHERFRLGAALGPSGGILSVSAVFDGPDPAPWVTPRKTFTSAGRTAPHP